MLKFDNQRVEKPEISPTRYTYEDETVEQVTVATFARRWLFGRVAWRDVPRCPTAVTNFGNIISLVLYRQKPFQVELFIVPSAPSTFTEHRHPDVDVIEFGLTGDAYLYINGERSCSKEIVDRWLQGDITTQPIAIPSTALHSGGGHTPYAFLSLQKWLNDVEPSSVGLNWDGKPASIEQQQMWIDLATSPHGLNR